MSPAASRAQQISACAGCLLLVFVFVIAFFDDSTARKGWKASTLHGIGRIVQMPESTRHKDALTGDAEQRAGDPSGKEAKIQTELLREPHINQSVVDKAAATTAVVSPQTSPTTTNAPKAVRRRGPVLYVIRSHRGNYNTRLRGQLDTWASLVDMSNILIVGNVASQDPPVYEAKGCHNDHSRGLCCKTGFSLALAAQMLGKRKWVFVVDDDHYVRTPNLERELKRYDASRLAAWGIPGCGGGHCDDRRGGFCGGGGYAITSVGLRALVKDRAPEQFRDFYMQKLAVDPPPDGRPGGQAWDDISVTCHLKRAGLAIGMMKGLYGWRLPESKADARRKKGELTRAYLQAIRSRDPLPITFHYIGDSREMAAIHEAFMQLADHGNRRVLEPSGAVAPFMPSYEEQMERYIEAMNIQMGLRAGGL